jgi:hypothetical protein
MLARSARDYLKCADRYLACAVKFWSLDLDDIQGGMDQVTPGLPGL